MLSINIHVGFNIYLLKYMHYASICLTIESSFLKTTSLMHCCPFERRNLVMHPRPPGRHIGIDG